MAVTKPALIGSSPAATAVFSTTGASTATAAPAVMVFETPMVSSEMAALKPMPDPIDRFFITSKTLAATHSAAPVAFISTPSEIAAA